MSHPLNVSLALRLFAEMYADSDGVIESPGTTMRKISTSGLPCAEGAP